MAEKIDPRPAGEKGEKKDAPEAQPSLFGDAPAAAGGSSVAASPTTREKLEELVVDALRTVYDPEIPVNIYDLGLIYDLRIDDQNKVVVRMTLTTPACPVAGSMPGMVEKAVGHVDNVSECEVDLVWEPPWNPDMMTEAARLQLNI